MSLAIPTFRDTSIREHVTTSALPFSRKALAALRSVSAADLPAGSISPFGVRYTRTGASWGFVPPPGVIYDEEKQVYITPTGAYLFSEMPDAFTEPCAEGQGDATSSYTFTKRFSRTAPDGKEDFQTDYDDDWGTDD